MKKNTLKVSILAAVTIFAMVSQPVNAQVGSNGIVFGQCSNATVTEVFVGPQFGTLVRLSDTRCGRNGLICIDVDGGLSASQSSRLLATALTAKATTSTVQARWDPATLACDGGSGGYPTMYDFRAR